ncbi:unnamed protein product [Gordionus sp. m RMFG-2023]
MVQFASYANATFDKTNFKEKQKPSHIRESNIIAAKAIADSIRTSLGPRGMDKMIKSKNGDVTITNDGATILKQMQVIHPAAKMLVELAKAQDIEAGDGTTTVVILAGSLLEAAGNKLLDKADLHPTLVSEAFGRASIQACKILESMSIPVKMSDRQTLIKCASTALNSKMVSQYSNILAPIAVDAIFKITDPEIATNVDLKDIKIITKLGGTLEDTELVDGVVFIQNFSGGSGAPSKIEKAKIGLIQFCISPPKTDMESNVIVSDYAQMDRVLKEERTYILNIAKQIKKAGCSVLLLQKSILRDAISELALHYFAKMKILVLKDIERDDVEFVCKSLGCKPIASLDHFTPEMLGSADLVEQINTDDNSKLIKITGISNPGQTVTILVRGSNKLILDEAERSLHDSLCVLRCLVKQKALIAGGGAPEIEIRLRLPEISKNDETTTPVERVCFEAFARALEVIPITLAENAGLDPVHALTDLKARHAEDVNAGLNVRKGTITNMLEENVLQPLLVSTSAIRLATETVVSILKIDDIV